MSNEGVNVIAVWARAAVIRALKTFGQVAGALIVTGAVIWGINWSQVLGVAATAAVGSLLTSLAGLPEVDSAVDEARVAGTHRLDKTTYPTD